MPESPALSSRQKLEKALSQLGLGSDTRPLSVLRAMMRIESTPPRSLDVSEIHDSLLRAEPGTAVSKGWVRKVLEQLSRSQMIRVENENEPRRKYVSDINTIVAGLEKLKGQTLAGLERRRQALQDRLDQLAAISLEDLARSVTGEIDSEPIQPDSRLVKGFQSYREFTSGEIYSRAGPGDVIRVSQVQLKLFGETAAERANQVQWAVENGADVRVLVDSKILTADELLVDSFPKTTLADAIFKAYDACRRGLKLDIRINTGYAGTYHFSSLNAEKMVILVSEDPTAAMWVSRRFNPDLIDTAIASFDQIWQQSMPLLQDPEHPGLGIPTAKQSLLLAAIRAAATRVAGGGT